MRKGGVWGVRRGVRGRGRGRRRREVVLTGGVCVVTADQIIAYLAR